jgi:hypothetical protein
MSVSGGKPETATIPDIVRRPLSEVYTDEGCDIWWNGRNRWFNGRTPREMWQTSEADQELVMEALDFLAGGFSG